MKKICTGCGRNKKLDKYNLAKNGLHGHTAKCKICIKDYDRTKTGVIYSLYRTQVGKSKKRGHPEPKYTRDELVVYLLAKKRFHKIYKAWVKSDFESKLRPSCDRQNNDLGYSFDNIKLMTWFENDNKIDNDDAKMKKVYQYTLGGKYITTFKSVSEASVGNSSLKVGISKCCLGELNSSGGFMWSYNKEQPPVKKEHTSITDKSIDQFTSKGTYIKTFDKIIFASRELNINASNISQCAKGNVMSAGGFKWEYSNAT